MGGTADGSPVSFWGDGNVLELFVRVAQLYILKTIELYTLNGWIVWCVNYTHLDTTFLKSEVQDPWESNLEYARGGGWGMY